MRELEVLGDGHLKLEAAECKEFFEQDLAEWARCQVKQILEQALEAERDRYLNLGHYEHSPQPRLDYRNGYYLRDFATQLGLLRYLRIPRTRRGFRSQILPRYRRRQEGVNALIRAVFLRGVSTREVGEVLGPVLGEAYSAQTISNIARELNREVEKFRTRRLTDEYVYLFLDGVVLKVRDASGQMRRRVVLVAYGITASGQREILAFEMAEGESESSWTAFLQNLYLRGLEGQTLRLISIDGGKGLRAALPLVYPTVPVQRCWAHKMRNLAGRVRRKQQSCVRDAAAIYRASSKSEAQQAFRRWKQRWQSIRPKAVACVEGDLEELLNFFAVPAAHWKRVRTTNVIERSFREVRRRTRPMTSFTNRESCQRIVFGVISHLNRSWERKPLPKFTQNA